MLFGRLHRCPCLRPSTARLWLHSARALALLEDMGLQVRVFVGRDELQASHRFQLSEPFIQREKAVFADALAKQPEESRRAEQGHAADPSQEGIGPGLMSSAQYPD